MKQLLYFLLLLCPLTSFGIGVSIQSKCPRATVQYSISELKHFLNEKNGFQICEKPVDSDWIITLSKNPSLKGCGFAVNSTLKNGKQRINLSGATEKDILYAVYTFLEKLGYTFEISGYDSSIRLNTDAIRQYSETITPVVKYRGIRQHINFPMDISSYPLDEAKEYIRNLARMRFNHITFHSYPGQWYEIRRTDTTEYAGNYFYGNVQTIPNDTLIRNHVRNKKYYCIPEIEPYFEDRAKRSQLSIAWLNEVMKEAKRVGMRVQLSFEPRNKSTNVDETIDMLRQIHQQYPLVDAIEMITEESGGWGPSCTAESTKKTLESFFGKEILNDTVVTAPILPSQSDLEYLYGQIGHCIKTIEAVRSQKISLPPLKLGIYCTNSNNVPAYYLAQKFAPAGTEITVLPGHGSANVAKNVPKIIRKDADWENTNLYSWLEFDGMMYLQQNGIQGLYKTFKERMSAAPNFRYNTMAFNHWRTAENKVTARYAALSCLFGAIEPSKFYEEYANRLGIGHADAFASAMQLLQNAFDYNTSNMAFAWVGYWRNGIQFQSKEAISGALARYETTRNELLKCTSGNTTAYGRNTVQLLENRLRATIIYHKAFLKLDELRAKDITNETYANICNEALAMFNECIRVYTEMMPDRGCEGTIVNIYHSPMQGVKVSRKNKTGIGFDEPIVAKAHFDAPAAPIFMGGD
jgi:hypothetical protein